MKYLPLLFLPLLLIPAHAFAACSVTTTSGTSGEATWGTGSGPNRDVIGQAFTTTCAGLVTQIVTPIAKNGTISDQVHLKIETTSGNKPTDTVLGTSGDVTITTANCSSGNTTFTFSPGISVANATTYAVVYQRTGALDSTNNYNACGSDPTPSTMSLHPSGGPWTDWTTSSQSANATITIADAPAVAALGRFILNAFWLR